VDDVLRSRRVLLSLAVGVFACGGREGTPVGVSPPRATERGVREPDAAAAPPVVPDDFRARLARISDRFPSRGHANGFDAIVWANDAARIPGDAGPDLPDGAMLVEETLARTNPDAGASGLLMMEKRAGAWHFGASEPQGEVADDARLALCAECHRDAPHDFVFRTPAIAPQSKSAAANAATTAIAPTPVATAAATYDARSAGSADSPSSR
jgi:hypothetical protein